MTAWARADWSRFAAGAVFTGVVAVAAAVYFLQGRHQWFYLDEWDFLASRRIDSLHDLLTPHNEHWSTIPILVYRALFHFVGLRSYRPYQFFTIGLHLGLGVLLRMVMRRAGVGPWVATAAASLYVLLGSGRQDIIWAFQIGYVGAVVFGVVHVLLAVHDGPIDHRDWFGLAAGLAGLMCSGVAVPMVVVVGVAVLVARGLRIALLHTVPLGVVYLGWLFTFGHKNYANPGTTPQQFFSFMRGAISATFRGMGQLLLVSVLLGVVLVIGLLLAYVGADRAERKRRLAVPGAMLLGAALYLGISAIGRPRTAFGSQTSRYVDVTAALCMPAIAVAADAFVRRWKVLLPIVLLVFVAGVPGNIRALRLHGFVDQGAPVYILTYPRLPVAKEVPANTPVDSFLAPQLTIGWLRDGVASGRVPPPPRTDGSFRARLTLNLALQPGRSLFQGAPCRVVRGYVKRRLEARQRITLRGGPLKVLASDFGYTPGTMFSPAKFNAIVARAPINLVMLSADPKHPTTICG